MQDGVFTQDRGPLYQNIRQRRYREGSSAPSLGTWHCDKWMHGEAVKSKLSIRPCSRLVTSQGCIIIRACTEGAGSIWTERRSACPAVLIVMLRACSRDCKIELSPLTRLRVRDTAVTDPLQILKSACRPSQCFFVCLLVCFVF